MFESLCVYFAVHSFGILERLTSGMLYSFACVRLGMKHWFYLFYQFCE